MNTIRCFSALVLLFLALPAPASAEDDPLIGSWKAVDGDGTTSIVKVYIEEQSLSAKITQLRDKSGKELNPVCTSCSGELKNQPVVGMRFIWGLRKQGTKWVDGKVVNLRPGLGRGVIASCELEMSGKQARILGRWGPFSGSDRWEPHVVSE
jgi:uncharacterized protein (DUF2147 family)